MKMIDFQKIVTISLITLNISFGSCKKERFEDCAFIQSVQEYQDSVKIVSESGFDYIDSATFSIDEYYMKFSQLNRNDSLYYGYHFVDYELYGEPFLYVLKKGFTLKDYLNIKKSNKIFDSQIDADNFYFKTIKEFISEPSNLAKNQIIPSPTSEGYIQFLFFHELGDQFALKWHSSYKSREVICSKENLESAIRKLQKDSFSEIIYKNRNQLLAIDPTPIVKLRNRNCRITWYEFEYWSGIYKRTYRINLTPPHNINLISVTKVAGIQKDIIL